MRQQILLLLLCICTRQGIAQSSVSTEDYNIEIIKSIRNFKFVKGSSEFPVQVKEESRRSYYCKNYRTAIDIAEFYSSFDNIDDVDIRGNDSWAKSAKPRYEYYNVDGIFYSDERICYLRLPFSHKGSTPEVILKKTTNDPRYFTSIYFNDMLPIKEQQVKLVVPGWMNVEVKELNFDKYQIEKKIEQDGDESVYTYTMRDIPVLKKEPQSPGPSYYAPHLLILCKEANFGNKSITYFKTLQEQYNWYRSLVQDIANDEAIIRQKAVELTQQLSSNEEKVKRLFQWVQDNIRYIAFENGIAGFKPDKAGEVLRKKYGDCKGMANLLTALLKSIQLDARRCWIGTKHIAYDYSTPCLAVDNHMICCWMNEGQPIYLDATEKYIGFGEIADRIQGRQVLIENGAEFQLVKVPLAGNEQNTATETRTLTWEGNNLKGKVVQTWKGESKQEMLFSLNSIKQENQEAALKQFLAEGQKNIEISNLTIDNLSNYNADLKVAYDILWKDAATQFDKEFYLGIDNRRHFDHLKIDVTKRKLPYWLEHKNHIIFETVLSTPAGKEATGIPGKLSIIKPGYSFNAAFTITAAKLTYRCEIKVDQTAVNPDQFLSWNADIQQLINFYNQQVVFTQTNQL